jgi:hypothetical protein
MLVAEKILTAASAFVNSGSFVVPVFVIKRRFGAFFTNNVFFEICKCVFAFAHIKPLI